MDDQQKRLFMALLMCAGATMIWTMFFAPTPPPPYVVDGSGERVESVPSEGSGELPETFGNPIYEGEGEGVSGLIPSMLAASGGNGAASGATMSMGGAPGILPGAPQVEILPPEFLRSNSFLVGYTNAGANMVSHEILEPEQYIPREDFGGIFPSGGETHLSFGLTIDGIPNLLPTSGYRLVEEESVVVEGTMEEPEHSRLVFRWSGGGFEVDKIFTTDPEHAYTSRFDIVVRNNSGAARNIDGAGVTLWADDANGEEAGAFNPIANLIEAACYVNDKVENEGREDAPGNFFAGPAYWAGVEDRYFLTAVAVSGENVATGCRFDSEGTLLSSTLLLDGFSLDTGSERNIELITYTGPKDGDALEAAGSRLERSVDYGWFAVICRPMKWVLVFFHGLFPNWGVAIILLTILIKLLMFPWTQKTFKSMERMKAIQPMINEVREKYQHDKTKMTEETMKLYKEHQVNPFGCLPMLLQMPIYIALYRMIYSSVELYKADFVLWINDLSVSDPYYILPVLMSITMMGQQLLTPTAVDNPQMKWVMRLMPIMFGFFMLVLPSGLVLYIFVSSLLGIMQQYMIRRQMAGEREEKEAEETVSPDQMTRQQRRQRDRKKKR